jgi:hypothetical protein
MIRNSQYAGNRDLRDGNRPSFDNGPLLVYAYVDMHRSYGGGAVNEVIHIPTTEYHILPRRMAKRLVYFRTEKQEPINTYNQLVIDQEVFEKFAESLTHNTMMAYGNREDSQQAARMTDLCINEVRIAYNDWGRLLFTSVSRRFAYVRDDGNIRHFSINFPIYLDPDTAHDYVYLNKRNPFRRLLTKRAPDSFTNHVHPMLDLNLPGKRRRR